jgi:cytochrome b
MNTNNTAQSAAGEIKVWDPLVRIFHWSLVATFTLAYITGEDESRLHELTGYVVIGLVLFRIVWGFVGTKYARFSDFVCPPATVIGYAKDFLWHKTRRYLGHNPLGGMMVLALLAGLLATGVTGYLLQEAEEGSTVRASTTTTVSFINNAFADEDDNGHENGDEMLKEIHEFFANFTLLLVIVHVAGVIAGGLMHRENLVRAMITGRKRA